MNLFFKTTCFNQFSSLFNQIQGWSRKLERYTLGSTFCGKKRRLRRTFAAHVGPFLSYRPQIAREFRENICVLESAKVGPRHRASEISTETYLSRYLRQTVKCLARVWCAGYMDRLALSSAALLYFRLRSKWRPIMFTKCAVVHWLVVN